MIRLSRRNMATQLIRRRKSSWGRFREIYDFYRLVKVKQHAEIYEGVDNEKDKKSRRKLREPPKIGEKVLELAEQLKKKDASGNLYKSSTKNISLFNREQVFVVRKIIKIPSTRNYHYWIAKEWDNKLIDSCFLRQELFVINDQLDWKKKFFFQSNWTSF